MKTYSFLAVVIVIAIAATFLTSRGPQLGAAALNAPLESFDAELRTDIVKMSWNCSSRKEISYFAIERSEDGNHYNEIGRIEPCKNKKGKYSFTDEFPYLGSNYYRVKLVADNGNISYSPLKSIYRENKLSPSLAVK